MKSFLSDRVVLHEGDSRHVLSAMADASIDAIVSDPPYGLAFMGKHWDAADTVAFDPAFWRECLRVVKPGSHVVAFGGTRTYHRLVCAIEDAGFEIRDQLAWLFGSGFPKSMDVSKAMDRAAGVEHSSDYISAAANKIFGKGKGKAAGVIRVAGANLSAPAVTDAAREWQGWGTALKPAHEPIVLARKPLIGTVAANVLAHGTGAINVDGCRVETNEVLSFGSRCLGDGIKYGKCTPSTEGIQNALGRFPANVVHDGSDEVVGVFPATGPAKASVRDPNGTMGYHGGASGLPGVVMGHDDNGGSAARFFYSAKADADDRIASKHPTVKPVDLMQWLVRLVTPKGGVVLDPFAGTGTTGEAAWREGMRAVLIEREAEYQADIARRMELAEYPLKRAAVVKAKGNLQGGEGLPLFGEATP